MIIGTVVEGPTDRIVIEEIIRNLIPGDHLFRPLQPIDAGGALGAGWKGGRRFCRQILLDGGDLRTFISGPGGRMDLLVIHLDADVILETDLVDNWEKVCAICGQAARFDQALRNALSLD